MTNTQEYLSEQEIEILMKESIEDVVKQSPYYDGQNLNYEFYISPQDQDNIANQYYNDLLDNDTLTECVNDWLFENYEQWYQDECNDLIYDVRDKAIDIFNKKCVRVPLEFEDYDINDWQVSLVEEYYYKGDIFCDFPSKLIERLEKIKSICNQFSEQVEEEWQFYSYDGFTSPRPLEKGLKNLAENLQITDNYRGNMTEYVMMDIQEYYDTKDKDNLSCALYEYNVYLLNETTLKDMRDFNKNHGLEADTHLSDMKAVFSL